MLASHPVVIGISSAYLLLKIFNFMKFLSIPENGSSWAGSLIYEIDTESSSPKKITIDILDADSNTSIGVCCLKGVTKARVDIAPYVRATTNLDLPTSAISSLAISSGAKSIVLVVNGLRSEARLFFRAAFDYSRAQMLSRMPDKQRIVLGDVVRFTAFAQSEVKVRMVIKTLLSSKQVMLTCNSSARPVEAVIPTSTLPVQSSRLDVNVYCDEELVGSYSFEVEQRDDTACTLAWFNYLGGVEYYTFPRSLRTAYDADVERIKYGTKSRTRVKHSRVLRTLISGCEPSDEMERIGELIFSPVVYCCCDDEVEEADISKRHLSFDKHNRLPQVVVELTEQWRGGELC